MLAYSLKHGDGAGTVSAAETIAICDRKNRSANFHNWRISIMNKEFTTVEKSASVAKDVSEEMVSKWYSLYRSVKYRSYELNTFTLSKEFFRKVVQSDNSYLT